VEFESVSVSVSNTSISIPPDILRRHAKLTPNHEGKNSRKLDGAEGTNYIAEPAASDDNPKNNDDNEFGSLASRLMNAAAAVDNNADNV